MENNMYLAMETLAAVIVLILLIANNIDARLYTAKRKWFNAMLLAGEISVITDAITYIPLNWDTMPLLFVALVTVTYASAPIVKMFFTSYLYAHISQSATVSRKPFIFLWYYCLAEFVLTLILCVTGNMFYFQDGMFYSGPLEVVYYYLTVFSVIASMVIVFSKAKILRLRGIMAVLPICVIPFISMAIILLTGLNLAVTMVSVSMLILYTTLQTEQESSLYNRATVDELSGLFNRTSYEDELHDVSKSEDNELLIYVSADLNGLKATNDSLGHAAGDELICATADCLKKVFGGLGKVFRTGGDEFAAILFADDNKLETLKTQLESVTKSWKGKLVDSLTLSVGYATKKEFPDEDIIELAKIADKRMYADKSRYYASKGVDRRGQNNAYKALSSLYTKILKINITDDSCSVIDMFSDEQTEEKGYSDSIFEWFRGFAKSGLVHPDDVESFLSKTEPEFMRDYFKSGNTYLMLTYRRKYDDGFRQAIMEIIPTNEYTDREQILYLYVKSIG